MSDELGGTPPTTKHKIREDVMEVVKKYLDAHMMADPNRTNLDGTPSMGVPEAHALDAVGELSVVLTYLLASVSYAKGEDKADMTIKFMTMVPILDKMLDKAYDMISEMDTDELFPGMRRDKES